MLGKPIRVGATFDNGPEFAVSNFKYKKHPEIAQADTLYKGSFVTCNSTLHLDPQPYAAFPDGIPEGISLGKFLDAQFEVFAQDMGYDYIWLSNGMGFGTEIWGIKGALFDKTAFYPEKADVAAETMLQFWRDFTAHWPADKIETRGSNFYAGAELSTDAAPLKEPYTEFKIAPSVNSPWAALNYNSGLELAAWMSHVAVLPGGLFPYRFLSARSVVHEQPLARPLWARALGYLPSVEHLSDRRERTGANAEQRGVSDGGRYSWSHAG